MTSNDIIMRGGLLISMMVLISIFTGHLASIKEDRVENGFNEMADRISGILMNLKRADAPSVISISFDNNVNDATINLNGRIDNQQPNLRILPGAIFLEMKGMRRTVSEDPAIIPAFPPHGDTPFDLDTAREISSGSGGYLKMLQGTIFINKMAPGMIFVYPKTPNYPPSAVDELKEMIEEPFSPSREWDRTLIIQKEDIEMIHPDHFILFHPGALMLEEGICPIPFILPPWMDMGSLNFEKEYSGNIAIYRMAIADGDACIPVWILEYQ